MRLVLNSEGWWFVQCLCGAVSCEVDRKSRQPFLYYKRQLPSVGARESAGRSRGNGGTARLHPTDDAMFTEAHLSRS